MCSAKFKVPLSVQNYVMMGIRYNSIWLLVRKGVFRWKSSFEKSAFRWMSLFEKVFFVGSFWVSWCFSLEVLFWKSVFRWIFLSFSVFFVGSPSSKKCFSLDLFELFGVFRWKFFWSSNEKHFFDFWVPTKNTALFESTFSTSDGSWSESFKNFVWVLTNLVDKNSLRIPI